MDGQHHTARLRRRLGWWGAAACAWSVLFAAPHFYWAAGGRRGLGRQAAAADAALAQTWFFAYNLLAGLLALVGAGLAVALVRRAGGWDRLTRSLRAGAWAAAAALSARGLVGVADLAVRSARSVMDSAALLVAIEPWFVLGGLLYGLLAAGSRRLSRPQRR